MSGSILSSLKSKLSNRDDSEHQQCFVRFSLGLIYYFYILSVNSNSLMHPAVIVSAIAFLIAPLMTLIWILASPRVIPLRRFSSMLIDVSLISYAFAYLGDAVGPISGAYLFITFGYGFRYGNKYLFTCMILSIAGFFFANQHSQYWQNNTFSSGIIIALVVLSSYVSILISQLYKAVNEAKAANEAKSQFLANMSHEIRTPLNGVIGMSELLNRSQLLPKQKDYASTIYASAKNLLYLINDILDISKIEAGKVTIETIDFDLHSLLNSSAMMLSPEARNKGLSFNLHISPDVPFLLRGDKQHLKQIIINLISNAIKFTNKGSIDIYVKNTFAEGNIIKLHFGIIDTGIGISENVKMTLFDKFTQADESTTRKFGGTGLGMAIAKQLVEAMDGKIDFSSELEKGSHFWFEIDFELQSVISEETDDSLAHFSGCNALIVSPIKNKTQEIESYFSLWPISYTYAEDAEQASNMIEESNITGHPYFVIFVFQKHLDIGSVDFIELIKSTSSYNNHTFILINDDPLPPSMKSTLLSSGYSSIITSYPDRKILFRAIHAAVAGINTITTENSEPYEQDSDDNLKNSDYKILVGEDNYTNQKVIKNIFEYENYNITLADNGEHALDILEKNDFDLIILDMQMPKMGGIETAKIYRFMYPEKNKVPIMILTANATKEAKISCEEANLDAFLTKPVEPKKLLDMASSLIRAHKPIENNSMPNVIDINNANILPLIDTQTLDTISSMAKNDLFLKNLIEEYITDTSVIIDEINRSIKKNHFDNAADLFHALDGSSRSIGAKKLARITRTASKDCQENDKLKLEKYYTELHHTFNETKKALNTYLENKTTSNSNI